MFIISIFSENVILFVVYINHRSWHRVWLRPYLYYIFFYSCHDCFCADLENATEQKTQLSKAPSEFNKSLPQFVLAVKISR